MSSCLSGGATAYGFDLDIVVNKPSSSPTSSSRSTQSSPSSTLSEACNSPLAISTKRARAPRKRPNQTYNEAAALLSTVYPNIFPKLSRKNSELLSPFPAIAETSFLLYEPTSSTEQRQQSSSEKSSFTCLSPTAPLKLHEEDDDDFDAESILDEEIGGGIDSIMGNLSFKSTAQDSNQNPFLGLGIGGILKVRQGNMKRALKRGDEGEWWRSPTVEVLKIAPKLKQSLPEKKKTKKKVQKVDDILERENEEEGGEGEEEEKKPSLNLKLNYEDVLKAWSNRGSPFSGDSETAVKSLKEIELFPDGGGVREASVLRYKEKRRTRLFSKKIRYQVRKTNADRRPRMKASGRFVRRPSSLVSS